MNIDHKMIEFIKAIDDFLTGILKQIIKRLQTFSDYENANTFLDFENINPFYPMFEIFIYFVFQLDYLITLYGYENIRKPMFNYILDGFFDKLEIKEDDELTLNKITNRRMNEYGNIMSSMSPINRSNNRLLENKFKENLSYCIIKQEYKINSEIEPLHFLNANKNLIINIMCTEIIFHFEIIFRKTLMNLFSDKPNISSIGQKEFNKYLDFTMKELRSHKNT